MANMLQAIQNRNCSVTSEECSVEVENCTATYNKFYFHPTKRTDKHRIYLVTQVVAALKTKAKGPRNRPSHHVRRALTQLLKTLGISVSIHCSRKNRRRLLHRSFFLGSIRLLQQRSNKRNTRAFFPDICIINQSEVREVRSIYSAFAAGWVTTETSKLNRITKATR